MDFLSPCRSCLQCLPFLQVSPESAPKTLPSAPPADLSRSSPSTKPAASPEEAGKASAGGTEPPLHLPDQGISPNRRSDADESLLQEGSTNADDNDALEKSISTPVFLGTEIEYKRGNDNDSSAGDSTSIGAYHSEPVLSEVPEDGIYAGEESQSTSQSGRRRRRDFLKKPFKGITEQIKQGGLHLKEEGEKHLQTVMTNINKQAQEFEQSGRFLMAPRPSKKSDLG